MYHNLDTLPPPSHFYSSGSARNQSRPWSPNEYDALPSTVGSSSNHRQSREAFDNGDHEHHGFVEGYPPLPQDHFPRLPRHSSKPRQEASEVSVEALDLADYTRTLRSRQAEDPYPPFPPAETSRPRQGHRQYSPVYPPSSFPSFARGGTRSSVNTPSSATHSTHSLPLTANSSNRNRPFSVPNRSLPHLDHQPNPEEEIDVTQFPSWSRDWYNGDSAQSRKPPNNDLERLEAYEMEAGLALPKPFMQTSSRSSVPNSKPPISPFDPAYIHPESYPKGRAALFDDDHSYPSYSAPSYNNHEPLLGFDSSRDGVVPWSLDPPEYKNLPLDPQVKEERIRMLEREFGSGKKKKHANNATNSGDKEREMDDGLIRDDDGKLVVGTPDGKGGLATQGPKRRATARFLQFALTVAVGGPVVWAAVALKPNQPPPPAGKPPFYILAALSPITFLALSYLFIIRPCTSRRRHPSTALTHPAAQGMMVLPVSGSPPGKKGKGGKGPYPPYPRGKKGKKGGGNLPGDVQVNLIVDPNAFALPGEDDLSSSEESQHDDGGMPDGYYGRTKPLDSRRQRTKDRAKRKRKRRRTLLASLKLEEDWLRARSWLRTISIIDALAGVLWAVAFSFVMAGKRCPTGGEEKGYGGWCTAYNASTAAACLLSVTFWVSLYFDVKDIYASKVSPRTRV